MSSDRTEGTADAGVRCAYLILSHKNRSVVRRAPCA